MERGRTAAGDAALIGVAAIWGITFPIVAEAIRPVGTAEFVQARFLLAALAVGAAAARRGGFRAVLPGVSILPGLLLAAGFLLQTEGLRTVGPSASAFLTGTNVVFVPILASLFTGERTTPRRWAAVAAAFCGIFLLQGLRLPDSWSRGETWTLLCALAFAGQIVALGRLAPGRDPLSMASGQMISAAVVLTVLAMAETGAPLPLEAISRAAPAILLTGLLATAAAFFVQTWAQRRVPTTHVAICLSGETVFAAAFSVVFFGDALPVLGWCGAAAVALAILLVTTERIPSSRGAH
ncbi:MAG: EamA family transporter [Candidatus Eisenbacteria bacterium]|nr:EamA family transporter [Candidatus Latescibacterota bacterium]MBD3301398.1 EamA family transporter [Candidatus Eisenbacteria bacterium]